MQNHQILQIIQPFGGLEAFPSPGVGPSPGPPRARPDPRAKKMVNGGWRKYGKSSGGIRPGPDFPAGFPGLPRDCPGFPGISPGFPGLLRACPGFPGPARLGVCTRPCVHTPGRAGPARAGLGNPGEAREGPGIPGDVPETRGDFPGISRIPDPGSGRKPPDVIHRVKKTPVHGLP